MLPPNKLHGQFRLPVMFTIQSDSPRESMDQHEPEHMEQQGNGHGLLVVVTKVAVKDVMVEIRDIVGRVGSA